MTIVSDQVIDEIRKAVREYAMPRRNAAGWVAGGSSSIVLLIIALLWQGQDDMRSTLSEELSRLSSTQASVVQAQLEQTKAIERLVTQMDELTKGYDARIRSIELEHATILENMRNMSYEVEENDRITRRIEKALISSDIDIEQAPAPPSAAVERVRIILDTIEKLPPPELRPDLWTHDGKPRIAALEQRCALHDVTALERDQAWALWVSMRQIGANGKMN